MEITTVRAVNQLTARWARQAVTGEKGTVLTAAGIWPLLAFLADGAGGPARAELAEALGIPAGSAAHAARKLLTALTGVRGLQAATGLWTRADLPLHEPWLAGLPDGARATLTGDEDTDREALDAWAADRTGGLIERMPVPVDRDTMLVLASALALRLKWIRPFRTGSIDLSEGPWAGRSALALYRGTSLLDRARVAHTPTGPVTVLEVVGDGGVDVHLVLGESAARPWEVLAAGTSVVTRTVPSTGASLLPEGNPGPGLHIGTVRSADRAPRLWVKAVAFDVSADHDLLDHARLFGLHTATDTGSGHFPGISADPLAVKSARQSAMARFHAEGFEAAAVTAVASAAGCALPRYRYRVRQAEVAFHRPFGFLAVHRTSRLVLAAGWVAEPVTLAP
ncbi:serpin family protein [Streptomyces sp. NBC_01006]|uniref:serpin family protein n=1 Tax=Streptomyces sp. NBC_01006 TaxID=2903716 RepID=UPI00386D93D2|nr:serpin family protein [Streptomyces sp. NBC_01006]